MQLVYMNNLKNKELYTTSEIIAECAGVQHHTITKLIRKYTEDFEYFGKVGFKIQALESGQSKKNIFTKRATSNFTNNVFKKHAKSCRIQVQFSQSIL